MRHRHRENIAQLLASLRADMTRDLQHLPQVLRGAPAEPPAPTAGSDPTPAPRASAAAAAAGAPSSTVLSSLLSVGSAATSTASQHLSRLRSGAGADANAVVRLGQSAAPTAKAFVESFLEGYRTGLADMDSEEGRARVQADIHRAKEVGKGVLDSVVRKAERASQGEPQAPGEEGVGRAAAEEGGRLERVDGLAPGEDPRESRAEKGPVAEEAPAGANLGTGAVQGRGRGAAPRGGGP